MLVYLDINFLTNKYAPTNASTKKTQPMIRVSPEGGGDGFSGWLWFVIFILSR
jgi:hypothetical protein